LVAPLCCLSILYPSLHCLTANRISSDSSPSPHTVHGKRAAGQKCKEGRGAGRSGSGTPGGFKCDTTTAERAFCRQAHRAPHISVQCWHDNRRPSRCHSYGATALWSHSHARRRRRGNTPKVRTQLLSREAVTQNAKMKQTLFQGVNLLRSHLKIEYL
jgi:hypothetical protein